MNKNITLSFVVLFFCLVLSAGFVSASENIFFNGNLQFQLKNNYIAGNNLSTTIHVTNMEEFPIVDGDLILEVVKGCSEPTYPSQLSDCDNIFYSKVINNINLAPMSTKRINFSYHLPSDLSSGVYRLDAYYRTERTPIVGIADILLPGEYRKFNVMGSGNFPYAKIIRTKTEINNKTGPIGVGVNIGDKVVLNIHISSVISQKVSIKTTICSWEDSICSSPLSVQYSPVMLKEGNITLPVDLNVPKNSGVYAIRLEVMGKNRLVSLYESRLLVMGKDARVRQLFTDKYYYDNEKMNVTVLVGGSPDHYTNPIVTDVKLEVKVLDQDSNKKYSKEVSIGNLSRGNFFVKKSLLIGIHNQLYNFKVCAKLFSNGIVYDNYCYIVDASSFHSNRHTINLNRRFNGDTFNGTIYIKDFYTNSSVMTDLFILVKKDGAYLYSKVVNNVSTYPISFKIEQNKDYTITVQDKKTTQEKVFNISKKFFPKNNWVWFILISCLVLVTIVVIILLKRGSEDRKKNHI